MGSEKYPYKGIIDHFANRGFSSGTNAWTDTDHTAYTVSTAGETGFLQILPIYFDHVLYPTITKAGFVTEVRKSPSRDSPSHLIIFLPFDRYTISMRMARMLASSTVKCKAARAVPETSWLWSASLPSFSVAAMSSCHFYA